MIVIYHANCNDGHTSAWVARKVYGSDEKEVRYVPAMYGTEPPDVTGQDVLILDFTYPVSVIERMETKAKSIRIIDHHKTAQADLEPLMKTADPSRKLRITFDMDRSGAGLAWDELMNGSRPALVDYIEDRDLWRFKLPFADRISAYLQIQEMTFERWDELELELAQDIHKVAAAGGVAIQATKAYVDHVKKNARLVEINGLTIPAVNAPQMHVSDLLHELCQGYPYAMAYWRRSDGIWQHSLRSDGDFDVSVVAKRLGGGGHKNAAGFEAVSPMI